MVSGQSLDEAVWDRQFGEHTALRHLEGLYGFRLRLPFGGDGT